MRSLALAIAVLLSLYGCAPVAQRFHRGEAQQTDASCPSLSQEQVLTLNLSQEMVEEGRLHAALANLQRLPNDLPEVRWKKARVLRLLRDDRSEALYRSLLGTCFAAQGEHGLGQLDFARDDLHRALAHFRRAVNLAPTDDAIRNDLGLVYLTLRRIREARFELLTAQELNRTNPHPVDNLLTLLLYQDMWSEAGSLAESQNVSAERMRRAERRAREMLAEDEETAASSKGT